MTVTATDILIFLTGFGAVGVYAHLVWDVGRSRADREDVLSVSIAHHIDARTAPVEWHTVLTCVNRSLHSVHVAGFGIEEVASRRQARRELKHPEELGPHRRMRELEIGGSTVRDAGIDGTSVLRGFILLDDGSIHYSRPNPFAPVTTEAAVASRGSAMFGGWGRLIARAAAPGLVVGASAVVLAILVWATPLFLRVVFLAGVALVAAAAGLRVVKLIRSRNAARNPVNLIARAIVTASYGSVERYTMLVNLAIVSAGLVAATAAAVGG